jgi:TonB family protein
VKRNWFVPYKAMTMKGCAVITVQFHKDGSHENPIVKNPSASSDYTRAAYNAIVAVSRMAPLPAQYQKDSLEFTITFSYDPRDAETLLNQNAKPAK